MTGEILTERQQYLLCIRDHGRGMPPEQVAMLSGRLQQGMQPPDHARPGIGLTLVKRLAELHLGSFSIQSQLKLWTAVEVSIPLSD